ncbi:SMP-30/gluconolactonase/LRE family protein [Silvibacterium acidisoli]|uniref:SMP-30/gluconolactonase/LRE family protein n=1 Tax=Acidobacteriaceae bacterium ZG23-2 TaxID=2883246 RepID=UPI00406CB4AC
MKQTIVAGLALVCALAGTFSALAQEVKAPRSYRLTAEDEAFWKLIPRNASLKTMGSGFGFTEGPVWDRAGYLWVSDEEINKIFRLYPDGHREEMIALGDPDGNTYDREHRLLDCASVLRAIIRLTPDGRSYKVLADRYEGQRFNSPNDVVLGPDGAIYFTDPTLDLPKGEKQEIPFQGVYRLDSSGKVTLLTKELSQPNGLAFTPDGKKLFVDDSDKRTIWVYDFHPDGTVSNGRIFGKEDGADGEGVPDGMRFDRAGHLFVTGPRGIWVWSQSGKHLGTIELPEQPANLSWGGKDDSTLYITATKSVYILPTLTHGFIPYE